MPRHQARFTSAAESEIRTRMSKYMSGACPPMQGHGDVVRALLSAQANVNRPRTDNSATPLVPSCHASRTLMPRLMNCLSVRTRMRMSICRFYFCFSLYISIFSIFPFFHFLFLYFCLYFYAHFFHPRADSNGPRTDNHPIPYHQRVRSCVRACVHACVRACVRAAWVRACVYTSEGMV